MTSQSPTTTNNAHANTSSSATTFPQSRTALDGRVYVCLTYDELDILDAVARVKSPGAGAVVMFAGTTRDTFANKRVSHLSYSAYAPRALTTMVQICTDILLGNESGAADSAHASINATNNVNGEATIPNTSESQPLPPSTSTTNQTTTASATQKATSPDTPLPTGLLKITLTHRLGHVPINSESIIITVSGAHRQEAWRAGEEALERCKDRVEVWKEEWLEDDEEGEGEGKGLVGVWRANRDGKVGVRVG